MARRVFSLLAFASLIASAVGLEDPAAAPAALSGFTVGKSVAITNATVVGCAPHAFKLSRANAPFVSVHFKRFNLASDDLVTISNANYTEVIDVAKPSNVSTSGFSSPRVSGSTVVVTFTPKSCLELDATELPSDFGFEIDALEYTFAHATVNREVCGSGNQNQAAVCLKDGYGDAAAMYNKAKAVGRLIQTMSTGQQQSCTGWLLGSQGHVVTNYHCISSADAAAATTFEFMVETPTCQSACQSLGECREYGTVESTGADFVYASSKYDYAVVKLHADPATLEARYGHFSLRRSAAAVNETIYLAHHPMGGAKQIAATQDATGNDQVYTGDNSANWGPVATVPAVVAVVNDVNRYGDFWTSYFADTETGSSGSPVVSRTSHLVIAVHSNGACENSGAPSDLIIEDLTANGIQLPADAYAD